MYRDILLESQKKADVLSDTFSEPIVNMKNTGGLQFVRAATPFTELIQHYSGPMKPSQNIGVNEFRYRLAVRDFHNKIKNDMVMSLYEAMVICIGASHLSVSDMQNSDFYTLNKTLFGSTYGSAVLPLDQDSIFAPLFNIDAAHYARYSVTPGVCEEMLESYVVALGYEVKNRIAVDILPMRAVKLNFEPPTDSSPVGYSYEVQADNISNDLSNADKIAEVFIVIMFNKLKSSATMVATINDILER